MKGKIRYSHLLIVNHIIVKILSVIEIILCYSRRILHLQGIDASCGTSGTVNDITVYIRMGSQVNILLLRIKSNYLCSKGIFTGLYLLDCCWFSRAGKTAYKPVAVHPVIASYPLIKYHYTICSWCSAKPISTRVIYAGIRHGKSSKKCWYRHVALTHTGNLLWRDSIWCHTFHCLQLFILKVEQFTLSNCHSTWYALYSVLKHAAICVAYVKHYIYVAHGFLLDSNFLNQALQVLNCLVNQLLIRFNLCCCSVSLQLCYFFVVNINEIICISSPELYWCYGSFKLAECRQPAIFDIFGRISWYAVNLPHIFAYIGMRAVIIYSWRSNYVQNVLV